MKNKLIVMALLCLFGIRAHSIEADEGCAQSINSTEKFLNCLVRNDPKILRKRGSVEIADGAVFKAKQIPNPELEVEAVPTNSGTLNQEVTLIQPLEFGGKKGARVGVAKALRKVRELELLKGAEEVVSFWSIRIHRLRQIDHEKELLSEIKETFQMVVRQYSRLGRQNPEQKVSLSTFQIAQEEIELSLTQLSAEEFQILAAMKGVLGGDFEVKPEWLPPIRDTWPKLELVNPKGAKVQIAEAEVELANKNLREQKSLAWPNIGIGAKYMKENLDSGAETQVGVVIEAPLPFWNRNQGGRAQAAAALRVSELERRLALNEASALQAGLIQSYELITKALGEAKGALLISQKHRDLHQFIRRGVISAPLIIELHRELISFYEGFHEKELAAVELLWTIQALQGRLPQEVLP